jgi:hypothetical protein
MPTTTAAAGATAGALKCKLDSSIKTEVLAQQEH